MHSPTFVNPARGWITALFWGCINTRRFYSFPSVDIKSIYTVERFKTELDKFLHMFPDTPHTPGYIGANRNSLILEYTAPVSSSYRQSSLTLPCSCPSSCIQVLSPVSFFFATSCVYRAHVSCSHPGSCIWLVSSWCPAPGFCFESCI